MTTDRSYLAFWGTLTTVVRAPNERRAFDLFLKTLQPHGSEFGRIMPPAREEVTIRPPAERDRGWIEDSDDPAFLALLTELVA